MFDEARRGLAVDRAHRRKSAGDDHLRRRRGVAIDRGASCEALSRSVRIAAKGKVQASAGFAFTPDHRRWGEFHAHLSRVRRAGSSAILEIADQPFLLVARGDWAWSRGPLQEQAIIAAARAASAMGSNRAIAPDAGSSTATCSTERRPRSMPRRLAAPFAALAKSGENT